ncbi:sensor histidine kinase [Egicoccus halophilus]|uniref:Histidine kinase domain-containing protein n=1 Tax=Egicoccus halophilus TaxID=1670830 RepID=A0A8J3AAX2_9ACTN|nr:sensor histidine kinase [Egicoccus halophilus]GGI03558.1 hypothetical protein GCM10011354_04630 [Egicoccus halophilus]
MTTVDALGEPNLPSAPDASVRVLPDLLVVLAVTSAVLALALVVWLPDLGDGGMGRLAVGAVVSGLSGLALTGTVLLRRRPGHPMGRLLVAGGLVGTAVYVLMGYAAATATTPALPQPDVVLWATNWAWVPAQVLAVSLLLRFPDGTLPGPRWRWGERLAWSWGATTVVVTAALPGPLGASPLEHLDNPYGVAALAGHLEALLGPLFVCSPLLMGMVAAAGVVRWRRADGEGRQQLRWVLAALVTIALAAPFAALGGVPELAEAFAFLVLPAAIAVAVLRHRLWDLGLVVRRGLVYGLATVALTALYLAVSVAVDARVSPLLAAGLVAAVAVPVRTLAQRVVERVLYGDRGDPDAVVRRLAGQLHDPPRPLLEVVTTQLARSLRLPYVAIEHLDGSLAASAGNPTRVASRLPLSAEGRVLGHLVAHERALGEGLGPRDRRLLAEVAGHVGIALYSTRLAAELRRSAERVLAVRDEERARLQRDLHDGLGPTLGAIGLQVEAARNLVGRPEALDRLDRILTDVGAATEATVQEVRRLLHDLAPIPLEAQGFEAATTAAARAAARGLALDVVIDTGGRQLPPAVEVAAHRIVVEAVHNAARHAQATRCRVAVSLAQDVLVVTVRDDGRGLGDVPAGVGIAAMRGRASDLGGTFSVATAEGGGTRVEARLPARLAASGLPGHEA